MSKLSTHVQVMAAESRLAGVLVELALSAIHESGLVIVDPRDDDTIGVVADQIAGSRSDGLSAGETALQVLDALSDSAAEEIA